MARVFIGTSGYNYKHWRGVFYPKDLPQDKWLEYYNKFFDTVELNVTFYRLPLDSVFQNWFQRTSAKFLFVAKGSRFITHIKRLEGVKESLSLFLKRAKDLEEKLGAVLWQLPPGFKVNLRRLDNFCGLLNSSQLGAGYRHSFEFRDESWFCSGVYEILRKYNFALVICDYPFQLSSSQSAVDGNRKIIQVPETADFIYLRRHGATALYASNYSDKQLKQDAEQIKKWLDVQKDVFIYFNNDAHGYAVKNALKLKELIQK